MFITCSVVDFFLSRETTILLLYAKAFKAIIAFLSIFYEGRLAFYSFWTISDFHCSTE